jgi:drug/metabolite transporter (DMT)-like permease
MANPTGKKLLRSSFTLLRANRQMLWVPILSTVSFLCIAAVVAGPLLLALHGPWDFRHYLVLLLALAMGNLTTLLFNVALTYAASANGGTNHWHR